MSLWMWMNQAVASKFLAWSFTCHGSSRFISALSFLYPHCVLSCCRYAAVLSTPARCLEDKLKVSWCGHLKSQNHTLPDLWSYYLFYTLTLHKPRVWPFLYIGTRTKAGEDDEPRPTSQSRRTLMMFTLNNPYPMRTD